jgi:hypothetical protein
MRPRALDGCENSHSWFTEDFWRQVLPMPTLPQLDLVTSASGDSHSINGLVLSIPLAIGN